jgi:hypothetical protein
MCKRAPRIGRTKANSSGCGQRTVRLQNRGLARPEAQRGNNPEQRGNWQGQRAEGRSAQDRGNYQFRSQDIGRLRDQYRGNYAHIDRSHRPHFRRGEDIPMNYRGYIQPVPPGLIGYLPPVPPGYALGYYDGYVVVYSLSTFAIVSVIDLLNQ